MTSREQDGAASRQQERELIVARTFDYEGEAACDAHMQTFLKCIQAAAAAEGQGFAAIKVGVPIELRRWSLLRFDCGGPWLFCWIPYRPAYTAAMLKFIYIGSGFDCIRRMSSISHLTILRGYVTLLCCVAKP